MDENQILELYYANNAKMLRSVVNKILFKFGISLDHDHYYSIANEVFVDVLRRYDGRQDFNGFLYSCLLNKVKTEFTRQHREKRKADALSFSLDTEIGEDGNSTYEEIIPSNFDIDEEVFGEVKDEKAEEYMDRLSKVQRKIVEMLVGGYKSTEIKENLHITEKEYSDNMIGIRAYENISVLF